MIYQWPTWKEAESRQEYINNVAEDTLDEYFTVGDTYNADKQTPTITAKGAQELYGYEKLAGESDEAFLERIAEDVATKYEAVWEAGLYHTLKDSGGSPREIPLGVENAGLQGVVAGVHYYRIIDTGTNSVICYKHKVDIGQDTLSLVSVTEPTTPLFVRDNIHYGVKWEGDVSGTSLTIDRTVDVWSFITGVLGKSSFGENAVLSGAKAFTPTDYPGMKNSDGKLTATGELLQNNYSNYSSDSIKADVHYTFPATAYSSVKAGTKTYYGSLMQALEATDTEASAGTNVVALQSVSCSHTYLAADGNGQKQLETTDYTVMSGVDYTHTINKDAKVGPNVTLIIPYDAEMGYVNLSNNGADYASTTFEKTRGKNPSALENADPKNYIEVGAGVVFENKGYIIIPGVVAGGEASYTQNSITSGNHSRIVLDRGATLKSTSGNITCYGYITEKTPKNGSRVEMTSGNIDMVFTMVEHRGGSAFSGLINVTKIEPSAAQLLVKTQEMQSSPFNRFYVESVTTDLVIYEGATAKGLGYMVVADQEVQQTVGFFGTSTTDFVQFDTEASDGGRKTKVTFRYDAEERQNQMHIEGSAKLNQLKLEMSIAFEYGFTVTVTGNMNTTDVYLPLSHYWDISCSRYSKDLGYKNTAAVVDSRSQDLKLMPGASMTVNEGVTFKAKNIAVYEKDTNIPTLGGFDYYAKSADDLNAAFDKSDKTLNKYDTYCDAELIVNGTLDTTEANGAIGGFVKSTSSTGKIISKSSASVDSKEVSSDSAISPLGDGGAWTSNVLTLKADAYVGAEVEEKHELSANTVYCSTAYDNGFVWFDPNITVTYNLLYTEDDVEQIIVQNVTATGDGGIGTLYKPSRTGYSFVEWYTDQACQNPVDPTAIKYSITLYAGWKEVPTYKITYEPNYPTDAGYSDADFSGGVTNAPAGEFTDVHDICSWNADYDREYYFVGWSATPDGEVQDSFEVGEEGLTLYAVWIKKVQVTINYDCGTGATNTALGFVSKSIWLHASQTYTLEDVYKGDADMTNKWYFVSWTTTNCAIEDGVLRVSGVGDASAVANWGLKHKVVISGPALHTYDFTKSCAWSLNINGVSYSNGDKTVSVELWFNPNQTISISGSVTGSKKGLLSGAHTVELKVGGQSIATSNSGSAVSGSTTINNPTAGGTTTISITHSG